MEMDGSRQDIAHFKHRRLSGDEVRLLEILPQSTAQTLHCRVHHVLLASAPPYTAISYRWGKDLIRRVIQLNSLPFLVTKNAWDAISSQNNPDSSEWLWIDSVCIDQDHKAERNHQVSLMARIFSGAAQVSVWLGQGSPAEETAFSSISNSESRVSDPGRLSYTSIIPIIENKYWSRVWVTQELLFARQIILHYGHMHAKWDSLSTLMLKASMAHRYEQFADDSSIAATVALSAAGLHEYFRRNIRQSVGATTLIRSVRLLDLVLLADRLDCYDPRDKIYGLVGIYNSRAEQPFLADYSKDTYELLISALEFLHRSESLDSIDGIGGLYIHLARLLGIEAGGDQFQHWLVRSLTPISSNRFSRCSFKNGQSVTLPRFKVDVRVVGRINHVTKMEPTLSLDRLTRIAFSCIGIRQCLFVDCIARHRDVLCAAVKPILLDQDRNGLPYRMHSMRSTGGEGSIDNQPVLFGDEGRIGRKSRSGVGIACPGAERDDYICIIGPPHQLPPCLCVIRNSSGKYSVIGKAYHLANCTHVTLKSVSQDQRRGMPGETSFPEIPQQNLLPAEFFAFLTPAKPALNEGWRKHLHHLYAEGGPGSYDLDSEFPSDVRRRENVRLGVLPASIAETDDSSSVPPPGYLSDYSSDHDFPVQENVARGQGITPYVIVFGVATTFILSVGTWAIIRH